jgi:hypothetical protein
MQYLGRSVIGIGTLAACIAFGGGASRADLVVNVGGSQAVVGGSLWDYFVTLDQAQAVENFTFPNFVTIYDFGPSTYVPVPTPGGQLTNWIPTTDLSDTPALNTTPTDDPSILNFRLTAPPNTFIPRAAIGELLGSFRLFSPGTGPAGPPVALEMSELTGKLQGLISPNIAMLERRQRRFWFRVPSWARVCRAWWPLAEVFSAGGDGGRKVPEHLCLPSGP